MKGLGWTFGGLIVLQVLVTSTPAAQLGGALGAVTTWLQDWLNPAIPLVPNTTGASLSSASSTSPSSPSSAPPSTIPPAGRIPAPSVAPVLA